MRKLVIPTLTAAILTTITYSTHVTHIDESFIMGMDHRKHWIYSSDPAVKRLDYCTGNLHTDSSYYGLYAHKADSIYAISRVLDHPITQSQTDQKVSLQFSLLVEKSQEDADYFMTLFSDPNPTTGSAFDPTTVNLETAFLLRFGIYQGRGLATYQIEFTSSVDHQVHVL